MRDEQSRLLGANDLATPDALLSDQAGPLENGHVLLDGGKAHRVVRGDLRDALLPRYRSADDVASRRVSEGGEDAVEVRCRLH